MICAIAEFKNFESYKSDEYVCMLFDLMLYRYPDLVKRVFQLLIMYFTRQRTVLEGLVSIQLLEGAHGQKILTSIREESKVLQEHKLHWNYWLEKNNDAGNLVRDTVQQSFAMLAGYCNNTVFDNKKGKTEGDNASQIS